MSAKSDAGSRGVASAPGRPSDVGPSLLCCWVTPNRGRHGCAERQAERRVDRTVEPAKRGRRASGRDEVGAACEPDDTTTYQRCGDDRSRGRSNSRGKNWKVDGDRCRAEQRNCDQVTRCGTGHVRVSDDGIGQVCSAAERERRAQTPHEVEAGDSRQSERSCTTRASHHGGHGSGEAEALRRSHVSLASSTIAMKQGGSDRHGLRVGARWGSSVEGQPGDVDHVLERGDPGARPARVVVRLGLTRLVAGIGAQDRALWMTTSDARQLAQPWPQVFGGGSPAKRADSQAAASLAEAAMTSSWPAPG